MKFMSYMLFVLSLIMFKSYAHKREFCEKCFILIMAMSLACMPLFYLVGDACAQIVAILLVYVSILACCSALCICRLDSCITNKGEESTQFMFPGGVLHQVKKNWEKCIYSGGACIHAFGSSFSPEF
jgi:hypothetical protein